MKRVIGFFILFLLPIVASAQFKPTSGAVSTITYDPEKAGIFKNLDEMKVVYAVNFWNTRQGTRLALRENIYRPHPERVKTVPLRKGAISWEAKIEIPANAAVLSYYITDGEVIDDNDGKTFTAYVYSNDGYPVPNAHYFMVPFLQLGGARLEERVKEAENEIELYPNNFRAYIQYFTLYVEQEKGSERAQRRIIKRLTELEQQFGEEPDCLNLIARTYYYILRDMEKALAYKEEIPQRYRWREVEAIFDNTALTEKKKKRAMEMEKTRNALINTLAPKVNFIYDKNTRISVQDFKGKPLVLVFWATTSEMSEKLFIPLSEMVEKYKDEELNVLAVNVGEDEETVSVFVKEHNYPFKHALNDGAAVLLYGVEGVPQTYIIDEDGIIKNVFVGYSVVQIPEMEQAVKSIL